MSETREKILIANRGEIACRIIKTAKKMGILTVAIFSDADTNSLYVQMADEAVYIGGKLATDSYLDTKKIIDVAKKTGAKYIHPGYGFLSENYKFAEDVEREGIIMIAPSPIAVKRMGDKIEAKKIAKDAGVSIVPGYRSAIKNADEAKKIAKKIGFPVMIKASAGGGGKGIRKVDKSSDVKDAFEVATNEAQNSFGDGRILIEKYIENPRHIEIQVIADKYKNIVCLGERECSIQRNNQKVVEEAPSPFVDKKMRQKMYKQAVALCKKIGYYSVGTVEFMVDNDKNFYFLEMNTRLQVEHGVTELITGLDLVELMIRIARGEKLPFKQKDIKLNGWAMESRICSEDPSRNFLPSSGRLSKYIEPVDIEGVRIDTGVYEGYEISSYYDSMIAKLLTHSSTREETIENMQKALGSFVINGIAHNISFLEKIINNEQFKCGNINTNFIKQELLNGSNNDNNEDSLKYNYVIIPVSLFMYSSYMRRFQGISGAIRKSNVDLEKLVVEVNEQKFLCNVVRTGEYIRVNFGNDYIEMRSIWKNGNAVFRGEFSGETINVKVISDNYAGDCVLQYLGYVYNVSIRSVRVSELEQFMPKKVRVEKPKTLISPIAGKLTRIKVKENESLLSGAELCYIEAMKMENIIRTEYDVIVKKINKNVGDILNKNDVIMEFEYKE